MAKLVGFLFTLLAASVLSLKYNPQEEAYNLNTNREAQHPLDYTGQWENHTYHPSPDNWRFPFYTLFLDRYVNGDPSNDNANGTIFEQDVLETQFRHGGDLAGLIDSLDYIQGIGIKAIYVAGTPYINAPSGYDGYSPLDLTLLDHHFGDINEWRAAVDEIHKRGMYLVLDNTMSTMGDLVGFENFLNTTTPFNPREHKAVYKTNTTYQDFSIGNNYNATCNYPRFWNSSGQRVLQGSDPVFDQLVGCYDSEFDQYGDTEAFGFFPDWQRQLSKFASVQDRLREWVPSVRSKIDLFACLTISMLDIDGFRIDKATQVTVDALAEFGDNLRTCARSLGKENFFVTGEVTGGDTFGAIYLGRGREPEQRPTNITEALLLTSDSTDVFLRDPKKNAIDSAAFHYSIYRHLTRLLGMDGNLTVPYDTPDNFVDSWNTFLTTNDLVNPNTNTFDPRHMYGVTNQDVFRWPAIENGIQKMLLGMFITTLELPGIPLLLWGDEQAFYVLDSTASNYIFGRSPMSSAIAWQTHGCYQLGSSQYYNFPVNVAANACHDDQVSLDHRDSSHPVYNIVKSMYRLRQNYPVLNDGYFLQQLSNNTHYIFLPGSNGTGTEIGIWSVVRDQYPGVQNLTGTTPAQPVWLVYQNDGQAVDYKFDCGSNDTALIAPFAENTTVKNLLAPYDEFTLKRGPRQLFLDGSQDFNGCVDDLHLDPWAFKAYVPKENWVAPAPLVTKFLPGHDARLLASPDGNNTVDIVFEFSQEMDCDSISNNLVINSTTDGKSVASIAPGSTVCGQTNNTNSNLYVAQVESTWSWSAKLINVENGIHVLTIQNASTSDGSAVTDSVDHFMFRIGNDDNPVVFPRTANYSSEVLTKNASGSLQVSHRASGADKWRYSTNWGSSWSPWADYTGESTTITKQPWTGTKQQEWSGEHVILQYWSRAAGSSSHIQHGDAEKQATPRRFPHLFAHGPFNQFGFDAGLPGAFQLQDGLWKFHLMTEWPSQVQVNVWGINPDRQPDQSFVYGDLDNDTVLDRSPPALLGGNMLNLTQLPPSPFLAYRVEVNDATMKYNLVPAGNRIVQLIIYALMWSMSVLTGAISIWTYMGAFYKVKFNTSGIANKTKILLPFDFRRKFQRLDDHDNEIALHPRSSETLVGSAAAVPTIQLNSNRRTVLIATMEYDIEDWGIKIKIGGLGVMAQLMGKSLTEQDLIWVVPCVGGIDYPIDQPADPMTVTILGVPYTIKVQYHKLNNITYVLLDAPIFRQQSKSEPYPPRMDDLDSAVYYSAWNACIAQACNRFPVDIYHINDYHGAAAPLYLLPKTIPCCLSLHNAEFQGLWPMRTPKEQEEVCKVFNLDKSIVEKYVQFGEVFNLLHAGASYLRIHQKGFGAVGVSNKYGARSYARYPIFWGLKEIGKLPNPDPSDTDPWDREAEARQIITVDPAYEASRGDLRRQAQEWAQLDVNPNAELFVFVGRWSNQKGVDLIADCFPAILEKHPNVQLICIGPVIDLYGKFAAAKLDAMMKKYPRRVYSKPVFTALPPFIFTGAEFALIPSRDEPFGLVAVEFGRKGALGVGARVGGLGQMPGWWYTVESTTTKHLQKQFKSAIEDALASKTEERALMRAKSAKQRFPVARWVEDLNILESTAIRVHNEEASGHRRFRSSSANRFLHSIGSDKLPTYGEATAQAEAFAASRDTSPAGLHRALSLGVRNGPGHRTRLTSQQIGAPVHEVDEQNEDERNSADEYRLTREQAEEIVRDIERSRTLRSLNGSGEPGLSLREPEESWDSRGRDRGRSPPPVPSSLRYSRSVYDMERSESPSPNDSLLRRISRRHSRRHGRSNGSLLDLTEIKGSSTDFKLQMVDPTFNDTTGEFYKAFEHMLQRLDAKNSEKEMCIEEYLIESEKAWFKRFRQAKLNRSRGPSPMGSPNPSVSSLSSYRRYRSQQSSPAPSERHSSDNESTMDATSLADDEFLLGKDYQRPSAPKRLMQRRIGDWPVYSLILALGQILAANSYQITLLTGGQGQTPEKLYIVGGIYMAMTCVWWVFYRHFKSLCVLSAPFALYGLAFVFVGMAPFLGAGSGRDSMRNVATGLYTAASASGSIFFALNFGDDGGAPIKAWVFRACVIQGTQQIFITALFYWGTAVAAMTATGKTDANTLTNSKRMAFVALPIAGFLWFLGLVTFTSLPPYYRQSPGKIPDFYRTLLSRKLILWFFVVVVLQNYFLSTPYGRNWAYLWSSTYAPHWAVGLLVLTFFVFIWAAFLFLFGKLSKKHSWILPIFAIGLGAPRWAQMLWATSGIGFWVPWMPGGPVAGALAGRSVWLWLGLLDSIQGVGFGMILLQTLTRIHIAVTLMSAQFLGTAITLIAKATAPDRNGPGDVFPDFSAGVVQGLAKPWFWIALGCQLIIPIGFFKFFRKEQLSKP